MNKKILLLIVAILAGCGSDVLVLPTALGRIVICSSVPVFPYDAVPGPAGRVHIGCQYGQITAAGDTVMIIYGQTRGEG